MPEGEHGLYRAGERLLQWMEACGKVVKELHDNAYRIGELGRGAAHGIDEKAAFANLVMNAEKYNRLACGLVPKIPLSAAAKPEDFRIDVGRLSAMARKALGGSGGARAKMLWVVHRAREAHERSRNLLVAADLPAADAILAEALATQTPKALAEALPSRLLKESGWWR